VHWPNWIATIVFLIWIPVSLLMMWFSHLDYNFFGIQDYLGVELIFGILHSIFFATIPVLVIAVYPHEDYLYGIVTC